MKVNIISVLLKSLLDKDNLQEDLHTAEIEMWNKCRSQKQTVWNWLLVLIVNIQSSLCHMMWW